MSRAPASLAAERAVRALRDGPGRATSVELAGRVLATRVGDEETATRLLVAAFSGDERLEYAGGSWRLSEAAAGDETPAPPPAPEADRTLVLLQGEKAGPGAPFILRAVTAIRLRGFEVVAACGGDVAEGAGPAMLRDEVRAILEGAVPVLHDPPGSLRALERWLRESLEEPISLRRVAQARLGMPARHTLGALAGRLGLSWRDSDDPVDLAETMEGCLERLRRPEESLASLRAAVRGGTPPVPWGRLAFDRRFLRDLPDTAGTYRFYDPEGTLLYVGKARNLRERVGSYFTESGPRPRRTQTLLDEMHRIEIEPTASDLEAALREAEQIARRRPARNVQREIHVHRARGGRLESILILEPAAPPQILRAYLIRDGQLLAKVPVGRRGGGLRRIERILDDRFFSFQAGPQDSPPRDVDVECIARWLAAHRDRVVAFDPTHLRSSREVIERLRWFLDRGGLLDPDGAPVVLR